MHQRPPGMEPPVLFFLGSSMGWVLSPPVFCAASETLGDRANEVLENDLGHLDTLLRLHAVLDLHKLRARARATTAASRRNPVAIHSGRATDDGTAGGAAQ